MVKTHIGTEALMPKGKLYNPCQQAKSPHTANACLKAWLCAEFVFAYNLAAVGVNVIEESETLTLKLW